MQRVDEFLMTSGFQKDKITQGAISTIVHYKRDEDGNRTRDAVEYELSQHYAVSTPDVEKIATTAGSVTDLLKDGIFVIGGTPAYIYTGVSAVKVAILADAANNARSSRRGNLQGRWYHFTN